MSEEKTPRLREMMPSSNPCTICRAADNVSWLMVKNGFRLYRCEACDHIFVSPHPSDEELSRLYSFESGYQRQEMVRFDAVKRFPAKFVASLEQLVRHVPSGSVLDIGSSAGQFLYLARGRGYAVQGIELSPDTAAIAKANGLPVFIGTLKEAEFGEGSFDAVHLGDVIEHVKDPEGMLLQVRSLLKPQGVVLVVTPNHDAFFPRTTYRLHTSLGIPWSHPAPPFHLNQFSVRSLLKLLAGTGFRVVEEAYSACSLLYELRGTGVFGSLKEAVREKQPLRATARAAYAAYVGAAYTTVWMLDRTARSKSRDFTMRLVATPE